MKRTLALLFVALLAVSSCKRGGEQETAEAPDLGPMPDVELPPVPALDTERPMQYPDGSISVWNLMLDRESHLGEQVRVTAYAKEIYVCPFRDQMAAQDRMIRYRNYLTDEEMAELEQAAIGTGEGTGEGERCAYPHMWVADDMNSDQTLLVTGYGPAIEDRLVVGERYLLEGRYMEETRGFNAAGRGLIFVMHMSGGSLDLPVDEGEGGGETGLEIR